MATEQEAIESIKKAYACSEEHAKKLCQDTVARATVARGITQEEAWETIVVHYQKKTPITTTVQTARASQPPRPIQNNKPPQKKIGPKIDLWSTWPTSRVEELDRAVRELGYESRSSMIQGLISKAISETVRDSSNSSDAQECAFEQFKNTDSAE